MFDTINLIVNKSTTKEFDTYQYMSYAKSILIKRHGLDTNSKSIEFLL